LGAQQTPGQLFVATDKVRVAANARTNRDSPPCPKVASICQAILSRSSGIHRSQLDDH
jgi:hypothetical protein